MRKVARGDFVKVCYTGKLEDGRVFDKGEDCRPLELQVGAGEVIQGFENALVGMSVNERKTFTLSPEEAYGDRNETWERTFERAHLPAEFNPQVGDVVMFKASEDAQIPATVKSIDDETLTVDFNHPLAGRALTFEVEITEIGGEQAAA